MTLQQLRKVLAFYGRFLPSFSAIGHVARSLAWPREAMDFGGQHWLVTGASGGIGRAIVEGALRHGARVTAVARDPVKLSALGSHPRLAVQVCDLALVREVEALAARTEAPVDVLVNNVGVLLDDERRTDEGHEVSYATNLLNHYLLTTRLLQRGVLGQGATVINMSSGGMYNAPLLLAPMRNPPQPFNGTLAYALHKRAQAVLTDAWRARYPDGPAFYVMHPGWSDTAGVQTSLPRFRRLLAPVLRTAEQGADTALWLAARRPAQSAAERVWFDRAERPAHVYAHTRSTRHDAEELVRFLEEDLQRGRS
jgi:dehydrogenase/reductase SDR family protein 12